MSVDDLALGFISGGTSEFYPPLEKAVRQTAAEPLRGPGGAELQRPAGRRAREYEDLVTHEVNAVISRAVNVDAAQCVSDGDVALGVLGATNCNGLEGKVTIVAANGTDAGPETVNSGEFAITASQMPWNSWNIRNTLPLLRGEQAYQREFVSIPTSNSNYAADAPSCCSQPIAMQSGSSRFEED